MLGRLAAKDFAYYYHQEMITRSARARDIATTFDDLADALKTGQFVSRDNEDEIGPRMDQAIWDEQMASLGRAFGPILNDMGQVVAPEEPEVESLRRGDLLNGIEARWVRLDEVTAQMLATLAEQAMGRHEILWRAAEALESSRG